MVLILPKDHDNIALKHIGDLLSLALEDDLLVIRHAFLDVHRQRFGLLHHLLPPALDAVFFIDSALASALIARLLHLHLHEAHVLSDAHSALSIALLALFGLATLGTTALALPAVNIPFHREVFLNAIVELFQRDAELKLVLGALLSVASPALIPVNLVFTLLVIDLALRVISQNLQRSVNSRELLCSILVT